MHLDIVTPRGRLLSAEVDEFTAPGTLGEMGVLPGHIPLVSGIRPGVVRYRSGGQWGSIAVGVGFLEVAPGDRCVILAQLGASTVDIDAATARRELDEAQRQLDHWDGDDPTARAAVEASRDWAQARLDAVGAAAAPPAGH